MEAEERVRSSDSGEYGGHSDEGTKIPAWIKVTAITAASVLAGGLAAAWIYRKSIARLQNPEEAPEYSNSCISQQESDE